MSLPMESIPEGVAPEPKPMELPADQPHEGNNEPEDSDEEDPPPPEWRPAPAQMSDLRIARDNSGQPTSADFARLLRRGNA